MWKDYFYFSKSERRAILILTILIGIVLFLRWWLPSFITTDERDNRQNMEEYQEFIRSLQEEKEQGEW